MHRSNGEEINFSLQTTISETLRTVRENLIANTIPTAAMISSETGNQSPRISTTSETIPSPRRQFVQQQRSNSNHSALLQSENYVTKRKALKLLTELLLDRSYHKMMMIFISSKLHLKTIMNMLKSKSMQIQYESFHVFKIFVANPHKSYEVASILYNNKEKLLKELPNPEGGKLKRFHSTASALHATQPVESSRGSSSSTASQLKSSSASSACLSHMGNMVTTAAPVAKEAFKVNAPPADNTSTVLPPSPPVLPQPVTPVIKSPCLDSLLKNVVSVEDDGVDDDDEGR
eukprot:scaffold428_cov168-Ochromonas_danica.AAC.8